MTSKYARGGRQPRRSGEFRSGLEARISHEAKRAGVTLEYEPFKIRYTIPASSHLYTPDWLILHNGIIVETKGIFDSDDRKKHLLIREQYPELDIRFVFSNINGKSDKRLKTTYGEWCEKHGFICAHQSIPPAWYKEPPRSYLQSLIKAKGGVFGIGTERKGT